MVVFGASRANTIAQNGDTVNQKQLMIDSLVKERASYVRRGLLQRVAAVDEVLASLGVREVASVEPVVEQAIAPKAKKRKSR